MAIQIDSATPHANLLARALKPSWDIVRQHRREYMALNILYYGLIIVGMLVSAVLPAVQETMLTAVGTAFSQGPMQSITDAYTGGLVPQAITLTFGVNLAIGTFATLTVPSLIIPFSGLLMGAYRALLWGIIYSPTSPQMQTILIPHSLTLLLEGQAYIVALLGVVVQGRALFSPRTIGASTRRHALVESLKQTARLYVLVILLLGVAAVYEVLEAVLLLTFAT